jgi:hypothetical protein
MLTESNQEAIQMGENEKVNVMINELEHDEWYSDIVYYLKNLSCPDHLVDYKRRDLRLKAMQYCLDEDGLGWKNPDGIILRCVNKEEEKKILEELHSGHCGGHFSARTTAHKILRARLLLTNTLFRYLLARSILPTLLVLLRQTETPNAAFETGGSRGTLSAMGFGFCW